MPAFFDESLLPPRRETFLAHVPRNRKLVVTAFLFAIIVLPPAYIHGRVSYHTGKNTPSLTKEIDQSTTNLGAIIQTDVSAPALNDQDDRTIKLIPAPDPELTEDTSLGSLPRIAQSGMQPWRAYARPFDNADRRPRVAIIITGLGLSREITDQSINQLPPTITLSFDSQGPVVGAWVGRARQDGHEAILEVPMEPFDFPRSDPGPNTLLTSLPNSDNLGRLQAVMRKATGYVGLMTLSGSRLTTDPTKLAPVLQVIHDRGLMVVDARVAPHSVVTDMSHNAGVPVATVVEKIDNDLSPDAIASALSDLEKTATLEGRAVGTASASPVVIDQIQKWAKTLPQRGIALAPISAMVR